MYKCYRAHMRLRALEWRLMKRDIDLAKCFMKIYENDYEKLFQLVKVQLKDGWKQEDIEKFFYLLGYSEFWVNSMLAHAVTQAKSELA